jgi:hypothetical protein
VPDSRLEQIAQNVLATLQTIVTPTYPYALTVERAKKKNVPAHLKAYIFQMPPDDIDGPINSEDWKQTFAVVVYVIPAEEDTVATDAYNNAIAASIHKALMTDYSRGGLAINTLIRPTFYFPAEDGELAGITFLFDVHYRHRLDDPFTGS